MVQLAGGPDPRLVGPANRLTTLINVLPTSGRAILFKTLRSQTRRVGIFEFLTKTPLLEPNPENLNKRFEMDIR